MKPAQSLHEALQSLWLMWVGLHNENADTGLSFGRLDQLLMPYFEMDFQGIDKRSEKEAKIKQAIELSCDFFLRAADHFPLGPDLSNFLFGGASSTQALTLGVVTSEGEDAVNDMTYILLKVTEMLNPRDVNVNARFHPEKNSENYLKRLCGVNFLTCGTPSMHNDKAVFASLKPHGYAIEEIRDWSATGCVEPAISGKHMRHTGSILMNLVAGIEMAIHDGLHPTMNWKFGPSTGKIEDDAFSSFEEFLNAYFVQQKFLIDQAVDLNNKLAHIHSKYRPTPLLSTMIEGPFEKGKDLTVGGAKYNTSGTSNIGLADVADSLLVIKKLVFDEKRYTFKQLKEAIDNNFKDFPVMHAEIKKYVDLFGSCNREALEIANRVAGEIHNYYAGKLNFRGGRYTSGFWSMSQHVAYGSLSGSLPSGRLKGKSFTPGLTPHPSASKSFLDNIKDVAKLLPENLDNNIAFNVKLFPYRKESRKETVDYVSYYVKTYFELGGMQMQFNVVNAETLKDAMANPENYRDLLVRISGYNAYFVTLNRDIQIELIERAGFKI